MVQDKIAQIKERISAACSRSGRNPAEVTILAVTKNRTVEQINEILNTGLSAIGENKVQEALLKLSAISFQRSSVSLQMIGHLQTNKAKDAVKIFDLIHSVDSLRLVREIDKQAWEINKIQAILIEVNVSGEVTKYGINPEELQGLVDSICGLRNVRLAGLMTIAPVVDDPEDVRPYFKKLRELRDKIYQSSITNHQLPILSMGMTDDFEVAVEEGATIVRIGRGIFE